MEKAFKQHFDFLKKEIDDFYTLSSSFQRPTNLVEIREKQKALTLNSFLAMKDDEFVYVSSSHSLDFAKQLFKQGYIFALPKKSFFGDDFNSFGKGKHNDGILAYLWLFNKILSNKNFVSKSNPSNLKSLQTNKHFPFWSYIITPEHLGTGSFYLPQQDSFLPEENLTQRLIERQNSTDEEDAFLIDKSPFANVTFTLALPKAHLVAIYGNVWDEILLNAPSSDELFERINKREELNQETYFRYNMPKDLQAEIEKEHERVFVSQSNILPQDDIQGLFLNFNLKNVVDLRLTFY